MNAVLHTQKQPDVFNEFYLVAAEHSEAALGLFYYEGKYRPKDYAEARIWIRRSAMQGNIEAQALLGSMYLVGKGVTQDETEAITWIRRAAEQGNADAQDCLGAMYAEGRGVPQDDAKAVPSHGMI